MDNDNTLKKLLAHTYKNLRFKLSYRNKTIKDGKVGNCEITKMINSGIPFAIGRLGATESRCIDKWMSKKKFEQSNLENIKNLSGVFPNDIESVAKFCEVYSNALAGLDALTVWGVTGERKILDRFCDNPTLLGIMSLEPYFYDEPWSFALKNKKILIVHPFVQTIAKQLQIKKELFRNPNVLPDFKQVCYVKAVQSLGGNSEFESWFEALDYMKKQIAEQAFDIAIIGAGAYALPLTVYVKSLGKQAIQLAGATQLLFGIRGKRWEDRPEYQSIFNEYWVYPAQNETPINKDNVEGGSYWK